MTNATAMYVTGDGRKFEDRAGAESHASNVAVRTGNIISIDLTKKGREAETLDQLREWMPKGSTVYTILRHVSRSGMRRSIGLVVFKDGYALHPNYRTCEVLGRRQSKDDDGVICDGGGMDMGFDLVYSLAHKLYGDGYALKHQWL